jgi:hypothetical protein
MTRRRVTKPRERLSWADVDPAVVVRVADLCDGHTIYKPEAFTNVGAPPAIVAQHVQCYESNPSDAKETIFDADGRALNQVLGVYGLPLIETICDDLGIEYADKMGRGFQAAACRDAIHAHFADRKGAVRG